MSDEKPTNPPTREEIFAFTPERATEFLASMQSSHALHSRFAEKSGEGAEPVVVTDENGNPLEKPPEYAFASPEEKHAAQAESAHRHLEALGLPDRNTTAGKEIWEMIEGTRPVNDAAMPQRFERAQTMLETMKKDSAFAKRLFTGDREASQDFQVVCAVVAAGKPDGGF